MLLMLHPATLPKPLLTLLKEGFKTCRRDSCQITMRNLMKCCKVHARDGDHLHIDSKLRQLHFWWWLVAPQEKHVNTLGQLASLQSECLVVAARNYLAEVDSVMSRLNAVLYHKCVHDNSCII